MTPYIMREKSLHAECALIGFEIRVSPCAEKEWEKLTSAQYRSARCDGEDAPLANRNIWNRRRRQAGRIDRVSLLEG